MASLLPPSSTAQERTLEAATARIGELAVPLRALWNADTCPVDLLPWLAWEFGVDEWDNAWSEEAKRATIRESLQIQRKKGSIWSIRRVLENAGYGTAEIIEGKATVLYDGSVTYNGFSVHGEPSRWATYRVVLDRPIANKQAEQVRRILRHTAPARCHLLELNYTAAANIHDGAIRYDGAYNHGTV